MEAQGYSKAPRRLRQSGQSTSASELSLRWGFHSFFFAQKGAPKNAGTQCSGSGGNTVLGRCEHTDGATELLLKQEGVEVVGEVHRGGQIAVEVREVHIHGPLVEEACRGGGEGRLTDTGMHKILTNISTPPFGEKSCFGLLLPGD